MASTTFTLDREDLLYLARSTTTPPIVLAKLMEHQDEDIRLAAFNNPSTPSYALENFHQQVK